MLNRIPFTGSQIVDARGLVTQVWFRFFEGLSPLNLTATLDFPSTAPGTVSDLTISLKGAVEGYPVTLGVPSGSVPAEGLFFAWVSAPDTVTVRFINTSTTTSYDPASGDFTVLVTRL